MNLKLEFELVGLFFFIGLSLVLPWKSFFQSNTSPNTPKLRDNSTSYLRGISIIGIVLIHVDSYFSFYHPKDNFGYFTLLLSNLSRFSVPIFIISSAIFLSFKGLKEFLSSRLKNLVLPYFVIGIFAYFSKYLESASLTDFIVRLFWGTIMEPYYYVPLLLQFYLFFLMFFKKAHSNKYIVFFFFTSLLLNLFSNHFLDQFFQINPDLKRINPLNFIFFFGFGLLIQKSFKNSENFKKLVNHSNLKYTFIFLFLIYSGYISFLTFSNRFVLINHFIFYPILCFFILYLFHSKVFIRFPKIYTHLCFLGDRSLAIFLIHPIVIHIFHIIDPYQLGGPVPSFFITLLLNIYLPIIIWEATSFLIKSLPSRSN